MLFESEITGYETSSHEALTRRGAQNPRQIRPHVLLSYEHETRGVPAQLMVLKKNPNDLSQCVAPRESFREHTKNRSNKRLLRGEGGLYAQPIAECVSLRMRNRIIRGSTFPTLRKYRFRRL